MLEIQHNKHLSLEKNYEETQTNTTHLCQMPVVYLKCEVHVKKKITISDGLIHS